MNKKTFTLIFGMFLLVWATVPGVLTISNFNIGSSISSTPLFFLNGTNSLGKLNIKWGDIKI